MMISQRSLDAILHLFKEELYWQIEVCPEDLIKILDKIDYSYNNFDPEKIIESVNKINNILLLYKKFKKTNHTFYFGREGSPVLYFEIIKVYLSPEFNYEKLTIDLEELGKKMLADEYECKENTKTVYKFRFWWD